MDFQDPKEVAGFNRNMLAGVPNEYNALALLWNSPFFPLPRQQSTFLPRKEPCNRTNVAFLRIAGGFF
jgi:hypothetical protein